MDKKEAKRAISKARRVFAYVAIYETGSKRPHRISKRAALEMLKFMSLDDVPINAEWLDDEQQLLALG